MAQGICRVNILKVCLASKIFPKDWRMTETLNGRVQVARVSVKVVARNKIEVRYMALLRIKELSVVTYPMLYNPTTPSPVSETSGSIAGFSRKAHSFPSKPRGHKPVSLSLSSSKRTIPP
jgi:hypothetical protein